MLYLFYGKDTFRIKERVGELCRDWGEKNGKDGIIRLNAANMDCQSLRSEVFSISMFSPKKFIIIQDVSSNQKIKEMILEEGDRFSSSENLILFVEQELKSGKSDAFSAFIKKKGYVEEFPFLEGRELEEWIVSETTKSGISIKKGAIAELLKGFKGDLFGLKNELSKLSNYVIAENRGEITIADIDKLVEKNEEGNIFSITDAIGSRNRRNVLILIDNYIKDGGVPLVLFATIATHVKNLMAVKASPSASPTDLGINPFVKMKCTSQAKNFTNEELETLFDMVIDLDRKMKIGQVGQQEAIEVLVLSL
jgi:DNA polymerase-3 subunit delta